MKKNKKTILWVNYTYFPDEVQQKSSNVSEAIKQH